MRRQQGFTLLELIIVLAVIGLVSTVVGTGMENWTTKKTYKNTYDQLVYEINTAKGTAQLRSTTSRITTAGTAGGDYTVTMYISATPVTTCSTAGAWTLVSTKTVEGSLSYQITGTGIDNDMCFYRDGTSNGGTFVISPIEASTTLTTATITVTIATGFLDVSIN